MRAEHFLKRRKEEMVCRMQTHCCLGMVCEAATEFLLTSCAALLLVPLHQCLEFILIDLNATLPCNLKRHFKRKAVCGKQRKRFLSGNVIPCGHFFKFLHPLLERMRELLFLFPNFASDVLVRFIACQLWICLPIFFHDDNRACIENTVRSLP